MRHSSIISAALILSIFCGTVRAAEASRTDRLGRVIVMHLTNFDHSGVSCWQVDNVNI